MKLEQLLECMDCKGLDKNKICYTSFDYGQLEHNVCQWYSIILADIEKVKSNQGLLTFPLIKENYSIIKAYIDGSLENGKKKL